MVNSITFQNILISHINRDRDTQVAQCESTLTGEINKLFSRSLSSYSSYCDLKELKFRVLAHFQGRKEGRLEAVTATKADLPDFFDRRRGSSILSDKTAQMNVAESKDLKSFISSSLRESLLNSADRIDAYVADAFPDLESEMLFRIKEILADSSHGLSDETEACLNAALLQSEGLPGFGALLLSTIQASKHPKPKDLFEAIVAKLNSWCSYETIEHALQSRTYPAASQLAPIATQCFGDAGPWIHNKRGQLEEGVRTSYNYHGKDVVIRFTSDALDGFEEKFGSCDALLESVESLYRFGETLVRLGKEGWKLKLHGEIRCFRGSAFQFYTSNAHEIVDCNFQITFDEFDRHR